MTTPFREDEISMVEFLSDEPEEALTKATDWLKDKDENGRKNVLRFLDLSIKHESELGWLVTVYCGKK